MFHKSIVYLLLAGLLLAACAVPEAAPSTPDPNEPVTAPPGTPGDVPSAPWEPAPGDENLNRGEVFIEESSILILESFPPQFTVQLAGNLPTPCHQLRVEVAEPDQQNRIHLQVYSVVDPDEVCLQVLEPFQANIPLGTPPPGEYTVLVNGEEIGEISSPQTGTPDDPTAAPPTPEPDVTGPQPWEPAPGDDTLSLGNVFIEGSGVVVLESFPPQFLLHLAGDLPTPCHQLRVVVAEPDEQNRIQVEAYSLVDPDMICIQVLEPFEVSIPLGEFEPGDYTVWLAGEQIGEFTVP
jgi:hypothetical protein